MESWSNGGRPFGPLEKEANHQMHSVASSQATCVSLCNPTLQYSRTPTLASLWDDVCRLFVQAHNTESNIPYRLPVIITHAVSHTVFSA